MHFLFDPRWATLALLCMMRLTGLLLLTPVLNGFSIPLRIRLFIVIGLSACLANISQDYSIPPLTDIVSLILLCATELALGGLMAFGIFTAFAAFTIAGRLLDIQIGFSVGSLIDPITKRQSPALASLFDLFAILAFFVSNLHHTLIRGFAASLEHAPLGQSVLPISPALLIKQIGVMFSQGLALAAPVAFCLLLVELGLAVLSRNIPQLNIFVISMPIKIIAGLAMLSLTIRYLAPAISQIFNSIFTYWDALLA
ncbi:flagellar biosynthetic protein FliR [Chitinivorax sp. B]|uniref:flagellar biosynthetic protein FliR n=1 Tax=Chitinivorax sp. B TaxID=2502235 RepID=UPI0010F6F933|nr:flagellar biosynthetic protein FliR [Chitinivorax sp. B]